MFILSAPLRFKYLHRGWITEGTFEGELNLFSPKDEIGSKPVGRIGIAVTYAKKKRPRRPRAHAGAGDEATEVSSAFDELTLDDELGNMKGGDEEEEDMVMEEAPRVDIYTQIMESSAQAAQDRSAASFDEYQREFLREGYASMMADRTAAIRKILTPGGSV